MKKQGLIAGFALAAAMALTPYGISAATGAGPAVADNKMPDGTVYAGNTPDTGEPMYTTPADAPGVYTLDAAQRYCRTLQVSGRHDFRAPSKNELNVLYENRNAGALKGTFNETGSHSTGYYWSSSQIVLD